MKTIEVTIDDALLAEIDSATSALSISRETFIHAALQRALREQALIALEQQHAQGYTRHPPRTDEFDEWEAEQVWSEL
jgi:metal-responsive CopG/Arc/MetJ family transcriptional regulator